MILRIEAISILLAFLTSSICKPIIRTFDLDNETAVYVKGGDRILLKCFEDTNANVQWYKNGIQVGDSGKRIKLVGRWLKIHKVKQEDAGKYQCLLDEPSKSSEPVWRNVTLNVVTGDFEDTPSPILEVLSLKKDADTDAMENEPDTTQLKRTYAKISKLVGDRVTLVCPGLSTGSGTEVTRQWYRNENLIKRLMTTSPTYVIETASLSDSDNYTCVVSNKVDTVQHHIDLKIYANAKQLPVIVETPTNTTVRERETAVFTCRVSSSVQSEVRWMKLTDIDGNFDPRNHDEEEFDELSSDGNDPYQLQLDDIGPEDEGWYMCYVSYGSGKLAYSKAWLTVLPDDGSTPSSKVRVESDNADKDHGESNEKSGTYDEQKPKSKPKFTKPDIMHVNEIKPAGNMLKLKCPAEGNPTPNITWTKNGEKPERHLGVIHYNRWSIRLEDLITEDSGNYMCLVCNSLGCIDFTFKVDIRERYPHKPYIKDGFPSNITALVNSTAIFECPPLSDLEPHLKWLKVTNVSEGEETPNGTLLQVAGWFLNSCFYSQCSILHRAKLLVERLHHRPILTEAPQNNTLVVGSSHAFTCKVLSDLHPQVEWFLGHVTNNISDFINLTKVVKDGGINAEVLEIHNVTHEDEGWYTCIAGNSLGVTYASAYLHVVDELEDTMTMVPASQPLLVNILIGVLCATFLLGVCIVLNVVRRLKREKLKKMLAIETAKAAIGTQWTKKVIIEKQTSSGTEDPLKMPIVKIEKCKTKISSSKLTSDSMSMSEYELPLDVHWEFPRQSLNLGQTLGEGAFGKVICAEANGILKQGIITTVAVKMLKEGHSDAEMMDLVSEMEMMKMIGQHINIINLLGVCTQDGPLYVIVEFAPHGNLRDFLRKHRPSSGYESPLGSAYTNGNVLTEKDLISFAYQVANGMHYLQSRKCIHRDLAARNVLVSDNYVLKIADFGLARDVHCQDYYRKTTDGRLPVKWMAPEALFHRLYTHQSDVWSYGILLWEIMTLGGTPYPSVPTVETLFQLLRSGHRMEKPPNCSKEVYELMRDCWSYVASERPEFIQLVSKLDRILTVTANEYLGQEYLELEAPLLDTPPSSEDESNDDEETCAYLL
ncbi:hypothetical protein M8J77_009049 [Diaphorina citri]|nr:hypothetical protein M8J77_009049 [Diaphorina citri]